MTAAEGLAMSPRGDDEHAAAEPPDTPVDVTACRLSDGRLVIYNPDPEYHLDEWILSTVDVDLPCP